MKRSTRGRFQKQAHTPGVTLQQALTYILSSDLASASLYVQSALRRQPANAPSSIQIKAPLHGEAARAAHKGGESLCLYLGASALWKQKQRQQQSVPALLHLHTFTCTGWYTRGCSYSYCYHDYYYHIMHAVHIKHKREVIQNNDYRQINLKEQGVPHLGIVQVGIPCC